MEKLRIFHNGKIATNSTPYFADAIAVEDGKIVSVGRNSEVLRLQKSETEAVDLRGQTVIPGLNDSHLDREWHEGWSLRRTAR
jgi:predicted amidohydrolase YtcJ